MKISNKLTPAQQARQAIAIDSIKLTLDPVFPADGSLANALVLRLPLSMRFATYSYEIEFLLGSYLLGKALDVWKNIHINAVGAAPRMFIPISMQVLADYRFVEAVTKHDRLRAHGRYFVLMGTPDSVGQFPERLDTRGLADIYQAVGIQIGIGDIQSNHFYPSLLQEGIDAVLPSHRFAVTNSTKAILQDLKLAAKALGIQYYEPSSQPWIMALPEDSQQELSGENLFS
ncbi:hypothetical protein [Aeromonas sp. Y311-2]|uniref:hypothetical protein n=1 Tax=Aeromonas sp. Y311-2 TaxID=2990507 RepID=UPI0022E645AE|nr:hypothetical protein [Aeromonas sp. Y311-2]